MQLAKWYQYDLFAESLEPWGRNVRLKTRNDDLLVTPWGHGFHWYRVVEGNLQSADNLRPGEAFPAQPWLWEHAGLHREWGIPQSIWEKSLFFREMQLSWLRIVGAVPLFEQYYEHDRNLSALICYRWHTGQITIEEIQRGMMRPRKEWTSGYSVCRRMYYGSLGVVEAERLQNMLDDEKMRGLLNEFGPLEPEDWKIINALIESGASRELLKAAGRLCRRFLGCKDSSHRALFEYREYIEVNPYCLELCRNQRSVERMCILFEEWGYVIGYEPEHWRGVHQMSEVNDLYRQAIESSYAGYDMKEIESAPDFPEPPLMQNRHIRHIASPADLFHESSTMGHCAFSYRAEVEMGESAFYHVSYYGDDATLELVRDRTRQNWKLNEIKGRKNTEPKQAILDVVNNWMTCQGAKF